MRSATTDVGGTRGARGASPGGRDRLPLRVLRVSAVSPELSGLVPRFSRLGRVSGRRLSPPITRPQATTPAGVALRSAGLRVLHAESHPPCNVRPKTLHFRPLSVAFPAAGRCKSPLPHPRFWAENVGLQRFAGFAQQDHFTASRCASTPSVVQAGPSHAALYFRGNFV